MILFARSTNRVYTDEELNQVAGILFSDGVFNTKSATREDWKTGGDFLIEPAGGMSISAKAGVASVIATLGSISQRIVINEETPLAANVSSNVTIAVRADAVVLKIDQSVLTNDELNPEGDNAVSLIVVSGSSATPLTDGEITTALGEDPFVRLADIYVPIGTSEILPSYITDRRELPEMTRAVKIKSDTISFYSLTEDPADPSQGDVWYNTTDGVLKMYDGEKTIAVQTQAFDWGYYPPDGIDFREEAIDPIIENPGLVSPTTANLLLGRVSTNNQTSMIGETFVFPDSDTVGIYVKTGIISGSFGGQTIHIRTYSVTGGNLPSALIEDVGEIDKDDVPVNDWMRVYLDSSLYTPGTKYAIVFSGTIYGSAINENYGNRIQISSDEEDPDTEQTLSDYLIGYLSGSASSQQTDPLNGAMSWGISATQNLIMKLMPLTQIAIGEEDATGNNHLLSQRFTAKSKDIIGFIVRKGDDVGSPTGDIKAYMYLCDESGNPDGNVIGSATVTEAEWAAYDNYDEIMFAIEYDAQVVGNRYIIVIDTDDYDDDNHYTILFGEYAAGTAKRYATTDGWVALGGDLIFSTVTSSTKKIVVTANDGFIPEEIIRPYAQIVEYKTPGNYSWIKNGKFVLVEIWGGGGGGAGSGSWNSNNFAGGGGGGAYMKQLFNCDDLPATVDIVVAAGGIGGGDNSTSNNAKLAGNAGGNSQFNNAFTPNGGLGGKIGNNYYARGGAGGGAAGMITPAGAGNALNLLNNMAAISGNNAILFVPFGLTPATSSYIGLKHGIYSGAGGWGGNNFSENFIRGGHSLYGGGGGAGSYGNRRGGKSNYAGNGGNGLSGGSVNTKADNGVFPSGGGGGGGGSFVNNNNHFGGDGANGMVRLTIYGV
jgi:hypothetical protein